MEFLTAHELPERTSAWCRTLGTDPRVLVRPVSPALLVVDMQRDFLQPDGLLPVWGGPAIIPNIRLLVEAFRTAGRPLVFTRHIYEDPERDGGATARWWKADRSSLLLREGTWHSELHEGLGVRPGDRVISKRRYSAFFGTDLEIVLRTDGVTDVVIAGLCTNICCEATAHDALFRDFNVHFLIDGTGATDEAAHLGTLRNIGLAYGRLATTTALLDAIAGND